MGGARRRTRPRGPRRRCRAPVPTRHSPRPTPGRRPAGPPRRCRNGSGRACPPTRRSEPGRERRGRPGRRGLPAPLDRRPTARPRRLLPQEHADAQLFVTLPDPCHIALPCSSRHRYATRPPKADPPPRGRAAWRDRPTGRTPGRRRTPLRAVSPRHDRPAGAQRQSFSSVRERDSVIAGEVGDGPAATCDTLCSPRALNTPDRSFEPRRASASGTEANGRTPLWAEPQARARAEATREATADDASPGTPERSSSGSGRLRGTTRSNRSIDGRGDPAPIAGAGDGAAVAGTLEDTLTARARVHGGDEQERSREGHGAAGTAHPMTTSSSGWRSASRAATGNSPSSSRKRTPWVARLTSPGRSDQLPPPTSETMEAWWCGARNGGRSNRAPSGSVQPAAEWTRVTVRASSGVSDGAARRGVRPTSSCPTRAARS